VRLRRFGGVGEGLAYMEKQRISHSLKRTRALYYLVTSLIKIMDTHVVYIRYLSPSSRRSFLWNAQPSSSSLQQLLAQDDASDQGLGWGKKKCSAGRNAGAPWEHRGDSTSRLGEHQEICVMGLFAGSLLLTVVAAPIASLAFSLPSIPKPKVPPPFPSLGAYIRLGIIKLTPVIN
jgi:hypothetical protein